MNNFKLEEYLAMYEFTAPYLLCCSDAESFKMHDIIRYANVEEKIMWQDLKLGYTEVKGLPMLRKQIVNSLYPKLNPDQILCFAGAEEAIFCVLYTLCQENDHVIVLTPCYQSFIEVPESKGTHVTQIQLKPENDWRIDLAEVKSHIKTNTKCIIINFPHNPSGQVITQNELLDLVALCKNHNIWLFSDEVYRLIGQPAEPWASPAVELYDKAISINVMTKSFGMAGLRVGWAACQNIDLLEQIKQTKYYTSICNSSPSEIISLIALRNKDIFLSRNNDIISKNLKILDQFLIKYKNLFEWIRPQGGCIGFIKYKGSESADIFCQKLILEKGVLLLPGSVYNYGEKYFRIGFGRINMPEALAKLEEFINDHSFS